MGSANKVPGISGGMISLVGGFYEELMYTLQKFNLKALSLLFKGRFYSFFRYINFAFIAPLSIGMGMAFFSVSLLLSYLMNSTKDGGLGLKIEVWSYFFGLIIGSIYYISKKSEKWKANEYIAYVSGASLGLVLSFIEPISPNINLGFIFFCGIVSVSGITLPGFSGSFLLIVLGNYNLIMVDSVNNLLFVLVKLFNGEISIFNFWKNLSANEILLLKINAIFTFAAIFGAFVFSNIMGYLLKKYHSQIIAILVGFITGSLGAAWPWKNESVNSEGAIAYIRYLPELNASIFYPILAVFLGIMTLILILKLEKAKK